jgi:hypothetical protein
MIKQGFCSFYTAMVAWVQLLKCDMTPPVISNDYPPDWERAFKQLDRYQYAKGLKWLFFALINGPEVLP